jgi:ribonuclease HI
MINDLTLNNILHKPTAANHERQTNTCTQRKINETISVYTHGVRSDKTYDLDRGGWGVVIVRGGEVETKSGHVFNATLRGIEMVSCIQALQILSAETSSIKIYSCSDYVVNCMSQQWYKSWRRNRWKTSTNKPVVHKEQWRELIRLSESKRVVFRKIEAHCGNEFHDMAEKLAIEELR